MEPNLQRMEELVHALLVEIGEDPDREGLVKTPHRVAAALTFLTSGYRTDPRVMIKAQHLCMMMRGVEKQNSVMVTSSVLGTFRESQATREEFLALVGHRTA